MVDAIAPFLLLESGPMSLQLGTAAAALVLLILAHFLMTRELRRRLSESEQALKDRGSELEGAQESLQKLCLSDPLTGLPNRRYVNVSLPVDAAQAMRSYRSFNLGNTAQAPVNADLVLMRVDVDEFKFIGEEHGFAAADQVLIQVRDLLQRSSRGSDAIIRLGNASGFLVVARQGSRNDAKVLAERILKSVEEHPFDIGEGVEIHCTCSLGGAAYPFLVSDPNSTRWEDVLAVAERCAEVVQKSAMGSWLLALPSEQMGAKDLTEDLASQLAALVQGGKLNLLTNLADPGKLDWGA